MDADPMNTSAFPPPTPEPHAAPHPPRVSPLDVRDAPPVTPGPTGERLLEPPSPRRPDGRPPHPAGEATRQPAGVWARRALAPFASLRTYKETAYQLLNLPI